MKEKISLGMARRIALAAQGFLDPRPTGTPDRRHLARVLARIGLLQIDSVSAVVRAHYMPLYSRLGPYPLALLDNAAVTRKRTVFEYWAHEASFLPVETYPLMRWRMQRAEGGEEMYLGLAKWGRERAAYIEEIYREVASRGPIAASALEGQKGSGGWWGWSDAKHAFEWLFWAGRITTAYRRGFERFYDLPERVLPQAILDLPAPAAEDAHRELLRISARAHGIATAGDLRDYFRLSPADMKGRLEELVEAGELFAGARRRLGQAGLSPQGRPLAREESRRAPCWRRSIRSSSNGRVPKDCSISATASRSTRRPKSASMAITSCRSCSATGSSRASTSRPTGLRVSCASMPPMPSPALRLKPPPNSSKS